MEQVDIEFFKKLADEFRKALEIAVDKRQYGRLTLFAGFPKECCRYTSDLLAEYLMDNGVSRDRILMLEGKSSKEGYTHCWLIIDGVLFVDITADQFNKKTYFKKYYPIPECYVAPCGEPYLYECFKNPQLHCLRSVGITSYSEGTSMKLQALYDAIVRQIKIIYEGDT